MIVNEQELAVDILFFLAPPQEPLLASLALACHDSRVPSHTAMRLVDVLLQRPDPPAVRLSVLLRLLAAPYVGGSWERQTEIVACLCRSVRAVGTTGIILHFCASQQEQCTFDRNPGRD